MKTPIFTYIFQNSDPLKAQAVKYFLSEFNSLCEHSRICNLHDYANSPHPNSVILCLTDLDVLISLKLPQSIVKIVAYFFTDREFQAININSRRSPLKARGFRLICPDDESNPSGLRFPSPNKVVDTIYARTTRTKFNSINLGSDIAAFTNLDPTAAIADIIQAGWWLRNNGLNHSDSVAGGIALRFGKGLLVTATNTDKYQITSDRICYIVDYTPENNTIQYVGTHLPSSETPLACHAFQEFPSANFILHFHYKPITCAPELDRYRTEKYAQYGTFSEAQIVTNQFKQTGNFAIARGHGEFVLAANFDEAQVTIDRVLELLK
jgi:ribulose-5-phosphate 4-epimerase/fuculose-1-phosphate aldolase